MAQPSLRESSLDISALRSRSVRDYVPW